MYKTIFKRILDLLLSFIILPFAFIICAIFAFFIHKEDNGPVFYIAKRRGLKGKTFNMFKLRSMKVNSPDIRNKDNSTFNSSNDSRVTKIGKIIRKTSIDELPQLINVIKGDMSLIGPRPTNATKTFADIEPERIRRYDARPGITGYAQAFYRNSINQKEKFEKDIYYVNNISFALDFKIFVKTILIVIRKENIYTNSEIKKEEKEQSEYRC